MQNYTDKTLGELLSDSNQIIRRNAISILKQLQRQGYGRDEVLSLVVDPELRGGGIDVY